MEFDLSIQEKKRGGGPNPTLYRVDENKVTSAFLQILHYAGHDLVSYLLGECDLPSNEINVESQVYNAQTVSRPDGLISCDCCYKIYVESKIQPDALDNERDKKQLQEHLKLLGSSGVWLIYLTPDDSQPACLNNHKNLIWFGWKDLLARLQDYQTEDKLVLFLIEQFEMILERLVLCRNNRACSRKQKDGLDVCEEEDGISADDRVIIVGGRWGEDVTLKYHFYACQPNRYFKEARYMAFCYQNRIKYLFEITETPLEAVHIENDAYVLGTGYFKDNAEPNYQPEDRKLFKLKRVEDYNGEIRNDQKDKNGNICAFVQRQRYTTIDKFRQAEKTSQL